MNDREQSKEESANMSDDERKDGGASASAPAPAEAGGGGSEETFGDADPPIIISG